MTDLVERLVPDELWTLFRRVVPPTEVIHPQGGGHDGGRVTVNIWRRSSS